MPPPTPPTTQPPGLTSYDRVRYPGSIQASTHPDRLAVAVSLCAMRPPDVEHCRVLELGCGDGVNLFPIAHTLPQSHVLGIDLAPSAVERGRVTARMLGLTNLTLRVGDLTALPDDLGGPFDYIIAHGVYSWVPQSVRDALLAACGRLLAPTGVAYVSYNTYPGRHAADMAREMMLYTAERVPDAARHVAAARHLLATLAAARPEEEAYGATLREVNQRIAQVRDEVLFHDVLAPGTTPVHFHDFVEHAGRHGLEFVTEADYTETAAGATGREPRLSQAVAALMVLKGRDGIGDDDGWLDREQFADFVRGRSFRRSLLCRTGVPRKRAPDPGEVCHLRVAADVSAAGESPNGAERFYTDGGLTLTTNHPLARAALRHLGETWPRSVNFPELLGAVVASDATSESAGRRAAPIDPSRALAESLLTAHSGGILEFRTRDPAFDSADTDRPTASPLARHQARTGATVVINLCGGAVPLEEQLARETLIRLDGSRDRQTLVRELAALVAAGAIRPTGTGSTDAAAGRDPALLERCLRWFERKALLCT